jgi:hypothetical protein
VPNELDYGQIASVVFEPAGQNKIAKRLKVGKNKAKRLQAAATEIRAYSYHFGHNALPAPDEDVIDAISNLVFFSLGYYFSTRSIAIGAKVVLASQESADRNSRAEMGAMGKLFNSIKSGASQPAQPAQVALPSGESDDYNGVLVEDGYFSFDGDDV